MVMADCPSYTKIAVMQLFYELKQKFPAIPDQVLTDFMRQTRYNRKECEKKLLEEYQRFEVHSYPVSIAEKMTEGKGRPKTLPLPCLEKGDSAGLFKPYSKSLYVEEQRRSGCVVQDALGSTPSKPSHPEKWQTSNSQDVQKIYEPITYHKTTFADEADESCDDLPEVCESVQNIEISSNQSEVFVSDLKLRYQNDNCGCETTSLQVQYQKGAVGVSHSAPTTPLSGQKSIGCDLKDAAGGINGVRKHRSSLNVDRSPRSPCTAESKRPFTSVMLTLRPPTAERQLPIKIATKGSQLVYSTRSYDAEQGYQNHLQICIGEDGNPTLTASRLRTADPTTSSIPAESTNVSDTAAPVPSVLPALDNVLSSPLQLRLREQKERKRKLEIELNRDKQKLMQMKQEVAAMERDLDRRKKAPFISEKVLRLQAEVATLRAECQMMLVEIESSEPSTTHFSAGIVDSANWTCRMCTFKNHPMLPKCEQCDMARVDMTSTLSTILRPPAASPQLPAIHPRV